jgi:hypothetical protein
MDYSAVLSRTRPGFTVQWSCRQGDFLVWLRCDPLAGPNVQPQILDVWSTPDETVVTITNRWQDFPPWFDLHPSEVKNSFVGWMKARVDARDFPNEPIDGPNIWRARGGDRIAWVGPARADQIHVGGLLNMLECREAVAVLANHPEGPLVFMHFEQSASSIALCRAAMDAERTLGSSRVFEEEWRLG